MLANKLIKRLPSWFRQEIPDIEKVNQMKGLFRKDDLHTVCESARCPNIGKCWGQGVATFMILGNICTRACRFCAVKAGIPREVDSLEPENVARIVKKLNLRYVVISSVTRDDLKDEGSEQFVKTISAIKKIMPCTKVEVLIPDFSNRLKLLQNVANANPEVISHNMETIQRLSPDFRPQANYEQSLAVLKNLKKIKKEGFVKTGFMVGLGESREEVMELMRDIAVTGCAILTIGQYLAPTQLKRHMKIQRFVTLEEFEIYKNFGQELGFKHVLSAPLARSSYIAEEGYKEALSV